MGSEFRRDREGWLLVCRQLPISSVPLVPVLPQDAALPPAVGPGHHPLPKLPLAMAAHAQAGWQQGSHTASMGGTHGGGRAESRHGEKERNSRVNDNDVVIST